VRGSEFTSKDATLQGDSAEISPALNAKFWASMVRGGGDLPLFWNSRANPLFEST
jgi:hypothetical protein